MISIEDFKKVDIRVGTIVFVEENKGAKKKAYSLKIDFGEFGVKNSSAQITNLYSEKQLLGMQVICVINFKPIKIASVNSEVLLLGIDSKDGVVLINPERKVMDGNKIY